MNDTDRPHGDMIRAFRFLFERGYREEDFLRRSSKLLGDIYTLVLTYSEADRKVSISCSKGADNEDASVSVSFTRISDGHNFAITDWIYNKEPQYLPELIETNAPTIFSNIDRMAALLAQVSMNGELGNIIGGEEWLDVPIYLGEYR